MLGGLGIFGLPTMISNGKDGTANGAIGSVINAIISALIGMAVAFILTLLFCPKEYDEVIAEETPTLKPEGANPEHIVSPASGTVRRRKLLTT